MIKVYRLDDLTLAYILDHDVCYASAASSGRSLNLIISQFRTKYSSSNCPNHVRRTMSSIKKRSQIRRILRTMFGEANVRRIKNGLKLEERTRRLGGKGDEGGGGGGCAHGLQLAAEEGRVDGNTIDIKDHTPSIAFRHHPPNSARFSYATEGALFISAQLSTDAVSALRKV